MHKISVSQVQCNSDLYRIGLLFSLASKSFALKDSQQNKVADLICALEASHF